MALRTADEYRASLRDGRRVVYRGVEVEDVTTHPALARTIAHSALLFDLAAEDHSGFWSYDDDGLADRVSMFFLRPSTPQELARRGDVIEESTRLSGTTLNIIKVVGTDALLALEVVAAAIDSELGTEYGERVTAYRAYCARTDQAMVLAATDPKGDRRRSPHDQHDSDLYLRIVERRSDGIVVSGAKLHTTASPSANELIFIPCRAMGPGDVDYALAFAIPAATRNLTMIAHPIDPQAPAETPISSRYVEVETLTILKEVFVPYERVFLCGEWRYAGPLASTFANYHRYTAVAYKPPSIDLLVGAAASAADQIGVLDAPHVRDKLARIIIYNALTRATRVAAAQQATLAPPGLAYPNPVMTNAGKYHFSSGFHEVVAFVQDIAGGLTVTAPGVEDLRHPEFGPLIDRYLAGREGVSGSTRWALVQLIRDVTASEFGGYNDVVTLHGEGSQQAQLLSALREYDLRSAIDFANALSAADEPRYAQL